MGQTARLEPPPYLTVGSQAARVRALLLVSGAFLAIQVSLTEYGNTLLNPSAGIFWFAVGCFLLWLVYGARSRLARGVVLVTSLSGAVVHGLGALEGTHAAFLAAAYLGHAVPLLAAPVRRHVRAEA